MDIHKASILASANPLALLAGAGAVCLLGIFCAHRYRDTNDFRKSTKLFLPLALALDFGLAAGLGIDLILVLGLDVCGFLVMALVSNHYFYH